LLNGFDRDRFIASAAIGSLSALPASGLFGRQASLGRPKACVCLPSFVLPSWTERPLLIVTESLAASTAALRQDRPLCLSQIKSGHPGDAIRRGLGGKEYALPS
jgi:hypothetical protein